MYGALPILIFQMFMSCYLCGTINDKVNIELFICVYFVDFGTNNWKIVVHNKNIGNSII